MSNNLSTDKLNEIDIEAIKDLKRSSPNGYDSLVKLLNLKLEDYRDVRSIDTSAGISSEAIARETCSRALAYAMIEEILGELDLCTRDTKTSATRSFK